MSHGPPKRDGMGDRIDGDIDDQGRTRSDERSRHGGGKQADRSRRTDGRSSGSYPARTSEIAARGESDRRDEEAGDAERVDSQPRQLTDIGMRKIPGAKATNEERAQGYQSARVRQTAHPALDTSPKVIAGHGRRDRN